jgi:hypothetical protein
MTGSREMRVARWLVAMAVSSLMPGGVVAMTLRPVGDATAHSAMGAAQVVLAGGEKVATTPDLPNPTGGGAGFGGTSSDLPIYGAASVANSGTYQVVAEAGDGPGATLCVTYAYTASRNVTISGGVSSVGTAIGGASGTWSNDYTTQPVQAALDAPAALRVQRAGGPLETLFSVGPIVEVHTATATPLSLARTGSFVVRPGDEIQLDLRAGVVGRGEIGSTTNSFVQYQIAFGRCVVAPVPMLSPAANAAVAALLLLLALGAMAWRRRPVGRR